MHDLAPVPPNSLWVPQVLQEAVDADERVVPWDELDDEAKDLVRGGDDNLGSDLWRRGHGVWRQRG